MLSENYSKARHSKARHGKPRNRQQSAPQQETFRGEKVFALLFLVLLLAFSGLNLARNGQKLTVVTNNYTVTTVKIKENRIIDVPRDFSDVTIDPSWDGESTTDGN